MPGAQGMPLGVHMPPGTQPPHTWWGGDTAQFREATKEKHKKYNFRKLKKTQNLRPISGLIHEYSTFRSREIGILMEFWWIIPILLAYSWNIHGMFHEYSTIHGTFHEYSTTIPHRANFPTNGIFHIWPHGESAGKVEYSIYIPLSTIRPTDPPEGGGDYQP